MNDMNGMNGKECIFEREHEVTIKRAKESLLRSEDVEKICKIFHLLSEPSRMKIVLALQEGEMCVYHLAEVCQNLTFSGISHQLRILKDNGIVKARRLGKYVEYSIIDGHIYEIVKLALEHLACLA